MGHSQAEKANSRERILRKAADAVRDTGLESVSVAKLMRSVDLTHGGFYNHFASRSDLLAQALERALVEGARTADANMKPGDAPRSYESRVKGYVSRAHRDARTSGCAAMWMTISGSASSSARSSSAASRMSPMIDVIPAATRLAAHPRFNPRPALASRTSGSTRVHQRVVGCFNPRPALASRTSGFTHRIEFLNENPLVARTVQRFAETRRC